MKNTDPTPGRSPLSYTLRPRLLHCGLLVVLFFLPISTHLQDGLAQTPAEESRGSEEQPYHSAPPTGSLPPVLDPELFDRPVVQNAYRLARKLAPILYQQPCYCHCARHLGHTSLLDCYATRHTAGCRICLQELFYVAEQTKQGRSPAEIRAAIIRGEWKKVNIEQDSQPPQNSTSPARPASRD